MPQLSIQQAFELAVQHHQAGRLSAAEQLYRQILAQQPEHVDAIHLLGMIARRAGRNDIALEMVRRALVLNPNHAQAQSNLGNILRETGQIEQAIAAYRRAIILQPNYAQAYNNLAVALHEIGRDDEAIAAARQAIALKSDYAEAHNNLGIALEAAGQLDDAIASFRQAIALNLLSPEAYNNLGNALRAKGRLHEAVEAYLQAIALRPDYFEAHNHLGIVFREKGMLDQAISACRRAVAIKPGEAEAYSNLGLALEERGELDEAVLALRQAIALRPSDAGAYNNLGIILKDQGLIDQAVTALRQSITLRPDDVKAHSNLLYALHYHPGYDARRIADEHRQWDRQHARPLLTVPQENSPSPGIPGEVRGEGLSAGEREGPHPNPLPEHRARGPEPMVSDCDPQRRLRIGYISPDFRNGHPHRQYLLPLMDHHDRSAVEIFCYSDVLLPDSVTERIRNRAHAWRNIVGMTDEAVADAIRVDKIDILVDLTMHMSRNRLLVFARKPAPVQATWLAYPASTGLSAIDYRLSDPYIDPPGMDESIYSEQTVRLPDTFWCYDPLDGREIAVGPLPALGNGFITFGCLNNFCKVNDVILDLWAKTLRQIENARLLLLAARGAHRQRTVERFARQGIDPSRIEFVAHQPRQDYLKTYHRIDVGLDTFPYNGHTTSLDSYWMGAPVVTLVGNTAVSRAGWCQLSNLGLGELAAQTHEQFVRIAVGLAGDLPRLAELRAALRERMERSPLMDASRFARNVEAAYRAMWQSAFTPDPSA